MQSENVSNIIAKITLALFILVTALELASHLLENKAMHQITKPLLMPLLSIYAISKISVHENKNIIFPILGALFFSWLGDSFLLYQEKEEKFFMLGLSAFLLAHLMYIVLYKQVSFNNKHGKTGRFKWLLSPIFMVYGICLIYLLYQFLGGMLIPVILYAVVLLLMGVAAVWRFEKTNFISFWMVVLGAVLFIVSDSMIALNAFHPEIKVGGFWVMLTYIAAQFLIIDGAIAHHRE